MSEHPSDGRSFDAERWPTAGVGSRRPSAPVKDPVPKRVLSSTSFLLDTSRRRRGGRMFLWSVVVALALAGVGLASYPFVTDVWAGRIQNDLQKDYQENAAALAAAYRARAFDPGDTLTKLHIPSLGVNRIVVEGITGNALRAGLGHYPNTALPGDTTGNIAIAGHRTGFGEPFRHLDALKEGDRIELETPLGRFIYAVMPDFDGHGNPWITAADDWTVTTPTPEPSLTLTTCDPPGTSINRLIVRARLVATKPVA
ncbi:MAG TPA: class E sortase [Actinomycetota bacterium]